MTAVPDGYELRRPTDNDLPSIQRLLDAYESSLSGEPHASEDDIAADANDPQADATHNWWLIEESGRGVAVAHAPAAFASVYWPRTCEGRGTVCVHPDHSDAALAPPLFELLEERARELARSAPAGRAPALIFSCEDADPLRARLLTARGYRRVREGFLMRVDLTKGVPEPTWPVGFTIRDAQFGIDDRALWRADEDAFSEHFLHAPQSFEAWRGWTFGHAGLDPHLWLVAWDGDEVAGQSAAMSRGDAGLVDNLMVRKPWRGRGLGLALLLEVFGRLRERRHTDVFLSVDAENATGAVRVYERAGMHVWRRQGTFRLDLDRG